MNGTISARISAKMRISATAFLMAGTAVLGTTLMTSQPVYAQAVAVFSRIDVEGNQRIAADTIRTIAGLTAQSRVTPAEINQAVQNLVATGFFESVDVRPEGGRLVIEVAENPTINRISVEGNKRLDDDVLLAVIGSQPRRTFTATQAEADVRAIVAAYQTSGRIAAEVTPKLIRRSDNRVDLVFEVFEGKVTEIESVSFIGNRNFSDRRLRRVVATKQARFLSTFFKNDTFVADRIEFDKQLLRDFYNKRGYIDFQVISAASELTRERNAFLVAFKVQEGQQYSFGDISVVSLEGDVDEADYQNIAKLKSGKTYDPSKVDVAIQRLDFELAKNNRPFVRAIPQVTRNDDTRTLDITFELVRGDRVFVERIDIEGNSTTLDRVIRRQFEVVEGDPFSRRAVQQATDRIRALDYFQTVEVNAREGSGVDQAVIDVNVEEKPTGNLSFGIGYSSANGASGNLSLTERNFLGRGQTFSASISAGTDNRDYSLGFVEPALFDRDLLAGFNLYYRTSTGTDSADTFAFDTSNIGFTPRIAFPISENGRLELKYRLSQDEISNVSPTTSTYILADAGESITSAVSATYTFDKRNSPIDPTAGFIASLTGEVAGLGGDQEYVKATGRVKAYTSLFNEDVVLSAEVEGGVLNNFGSGSRVTDRFFLGGDDFRGFENLGLGPRDGTTALGGNMFAVARLEASFPIGLPEEYGIYGGVFFDVGSVWDLDGTLPATLEANSDDFNLRSSIGVSIFWDTAIGPLRFNFARAIKKEDYDNEESFRFTVDTRF